MWRGKGGPGTGRVEKGGVGEVLEAKEGADMFLLGGLVAVSTVQLGSETCRDLDWKEVKE